MSFAISQQRLKKCSPFFIGKAKMEKTRIHFTPLDMTKSLLCIGPMGSGKTVFFKNLLAQEWYTRALIRCAKGQDFTPVVVDHKRGFALNLYNKSAAIWDIMSEKNFLLMLPPVALDFMVGAVGESKDAAFFANSAADRIKGMFERAYLTGNDSKARWSALEEEMQKFEESVADLNSRENSDVWNNLLLVRETIFFWAWRVQESENTFTISDFLTSNKKLVMNGSEIAVRCYYSSLVSAIVQEMLRMPDTETDLTFMLLDEYLTMPLSETTRKQLHTMGRSKGACIVSGLLFLPGDDVAVQQVLSSSRFCTILFNVQDKVTSDYFKDYFGEVKHKESEISTSRNKNDYVTGVSSSSQERVSSFLGQEELQRKPAYTHLTILQTEEAYLGYTPQIKMTEHYNPLSDVLDVEPFKRKMHKMKQNQSE